MDNRGTGDNAYYFSWLAAYSSGRFFVSHNQIGANPQSQKRLPARDARTESRLTTPIRE